MTKFDDRKALMPRIRLPKASDLAAARSDSYALGLHTVCKEALCPNQAECAASRTATFLILGDICTRNCRFCAVSKGAPIPVNPEEPALVARTAQEMGLAHVVVTSVTRDDLPDGGAGAFEQVIRTVHGQGMTVETLIPDFAGDVDSLRIVLEAEPDVLNHNLETVPRLYSRLRPGASYEQSLKLLERSRMHNPTIPTKTGVMLGLGETMEEIRELFDDVGRTGCTAIMVGQYLQPTRDHAAVRKYYAPEEFAALAEQARGCGIPSVFAGSLVRSSYKAGSIIGELRKQVARKG
jgi:lipoic acid synthetase